MADDDSTDGFLSRWSRRKAQVREGRPSDEPALVQPQSPLSPLTPVMPAMPDAAPEPPKPTLAQAQQLTPDSDFTDFVARGVTPEVKNAAMKKLFTDPHFNVMDRLDIYIDDYSQPDPLPLSMLRQMTSAKALNLFDDASEHAVVADTDPPSSNNPEPTPHDHVDLRLQPDPTARPEGAEPNPV